MIFSPGSPPFQQFHALSSPARRCDYLPPRRNLSRSSFSLDDVGFMQRSALVRVPVLFPCAWLSLHSVAGEQVPTRVSPGLASDFRPRTPPTSSSWICTEHSPKGMRSLCDDRASFPPWDTPRLYSAKCSFSSCFATLCASVPQSRSRSLRQSKVLFLRLKHEKSRQLSSRTPPFPPSSP